MSGAYEALLDTAARAVGHDEARKALAEVLHLFTEKGHPGRPCRRTGWVYEETVPRWRAVLADTGPTPNAPSEAAP